MNYVYESIPETDFSRPELQGVTHPANYRPLLPGKGLNSWAIDRAADSFLIRLGISGHDHEPPWQWMLFRFEGATQKLAFRCKETGSPSSGFTHKYFGGIDGNVADALEIAERNSQMLTALAKAIFVGYQRLMPKLISVECSPNPFPAEEA